MGNRPSNRNGCTFPINTDMNKTLVLDFYPIIDPYNTNPIVVDNIYNEVLRLAYNGEPLDIPSNVALARTWTLEKSVTVRTTESNTISFNLEQRFQGQLNIMVGRITLTKLNETQWEVFHHYDLRGIDADNQDYFNSVLNIQSEGMKFSVISPLFNEVVLHNINVCEANTLYTNSAIIDWDGIEKLVFAYEETGETVNNEPFIQALTFTLNG